MTALREAQESPVEQGPLESIAWKLDTTPWGGGPTSVVSVEVYDMTDIGTDLEATVMPAGDHTIAGDLIILKPLKSLTEGLTYRVDVTFANSRGTQTAFFRVKCK